MPTFNFPKDYLEFAARWYLALKPPSRCVISCKFCSPVRTL
jgi:hypothetical protein